MSLAPGAQSVTRTLGLLPYNADTAHAAFRVSRLLLRNQLLAAHGWPTFMQEFY